MKRVLIYNLWVILLSYNFLFNNKIILGILIETILLIYNFMLVRKINYWRFLSILLLTYLFSLKVIAYNSICTNILIYPFLLLVCTNTSIVNELAYKLKAIYLRSIYFILSISFFIFILIAIIIPYSSLLPNYKMDVYTYVALIFIPSFILFSICLILKHINRKIINTNYVLK